MKALFEKPYVGKALRALKPWALWIGLFVVLKVTGLGSEITYTTQSMLLKAGVFDATPTPRAEEDFPYSFRVKDLNGKVVEMKDLKGKVIFLNLWATWCGPCRAEMPSIQKLYNEVDKEKIAFVILSLDQENQSKKVARFVSQKDFSFPVYLPASPLPDALRVNTIPTTFIVGTDGKIKHKKVGMANYDTPEMRAFLSQLTQ